MRTALTLLLAWFGLEAAAQDALTAHRDTVDLFVLAGQSNAVGVGGDPALATGVIHGSAWAVRVRAERETRDAIVSLDTLGRDTYLDGTLAPAFAEAYVRIRDRRVAFLQTAVGGTSNVPTADQGKGHWSALERGPSPVGGPNRLAMALDTLEAAYAARRPSMPEFRLGGVVWIQGERDAQQIDNGLITPETYEAELRATLAFLRDTLEAREGREVPIYLVQIGYLAEGDTDGFERVREIQRAVAASGLATLACDHGTAFPALGMLADFGHWDQRALNHVGAHVAEAAAADAPPGRPRPTATPAGPGASTVRVLGNPASRLARFSEPVTGVVLDALGREVVRLEAADRTPPLPPGVYALRSDRGAVRFTVAR